MSDTEFPPRASRPAFPVGGPNGSSFPDRAPGTFHDDFGETLEAPVPNPGADSPHPVGPRDLLADADFLRRLAREYAGMGCWSISAALDRAAILTEQMYEAITAMHGNAQWGKGETRNDRIR